MALLEATQMVFTPGAAGGERVQYSTLLNIFTHIGFTPGTLATTKYFRQKSTKSNK